MEEITDLVEIWDGDRCGPVQQRLHRLVTDKITDARRRIDELAALTADLQLAASQLAGPECACVADASASSTAVAVALMPKPDTPIACTLTADDVDGRLEDWREMLAEATERIRIAETSSGAPSRARRRSSPADGSLDNG